MSSSTFPIGIHPSGSPVRPFAYAFSFSMPFISRTGMPSCVTPFS